MCCFHGYQILAGRPHALQLSLKHPAVELPGRHSPLIAETGRKGCAPVLFAVPGTR